jgi:hypothetical protein
MTIEFEPDQEFTVIYVACRWIGTRGDYGPWTEIHKTIVMR